MAKKEYMRPTSQVITLAGENMLFTPSIPKHQSGDGTSTGGSDAESKEFFYEEEWDMGVEAD